MIGTPRPRTTSPSSSPGARARPRPGGKLERPLTSAALERSALWHLGRRALTTAELRERLQKKAARHPEHPLSSSWIDALVTRLSSSLILDDARVARARVESGRARGLSKRRIQQKLRGVERDVADDAFVVVDTLGEANDEGGERSARDADLEAAVVFAQKKRLARKEPQKALASLARQGFSYDVAKRALATLSR